MSQSNVVVHLPASIELSKRTSQNSLNIDIRIKANGHSTKKGRLVIGKGTVEWWPGSKSVNCYGGTLADFIDVLRKLPRTRSNRKKSST